jgi:hypothetical protein
MIQLPKTHILDLSTELHQYQSPKQFQNILYNASYAQQLQNEIHNRNGINSKSSCVKLEMTTKKKKLDKNIVCNNF